ncbi:MAG TPA: YegS/Rv2252/BmrU family lipid kinase [Longimicrobium sp.]|nr:YegS/Rv2252/BmrU family lipid kinase [Longimicrobium sp.]
MHVSVIIHPPSIEGVEAMRAAIEKLRDAGHTVHPRLTFEGGDASRFAWKAAEHGADLVVAAGGDGTINEVVNGLLEWAEEHEGERRLPRLGIVPMGTANDLAGGLGIASGDPEAAMAIAVAGTEYEVDVARVNGRYFLNVSTGGAGAEATDEASDELKRVLGPIAYLITGVRKFVELKVSRARFTSRGETLHDGEFLIFAVGNARRTGGGNFITAEADMEDRLLDACIVESLTHLEAARIAPKLRAGTHVDNPHVTYRKVPELLVEAEHELTVNADGEPVTARRFEYSIAPHRLTLMVPHPKPEEGAGA